MEYKKISQYQSLIAASLIIFLFFIPTPSVITAIFLWIIIFIVCNQLIHNLTFSIFIATAFLALFIIFNQIGKKKTHYQPINQFNDLFLENFDGGEQENQENTLLVENPQKETEEINVDAQFKNDDEVEVEKPPKISMMDENNNDEDDAFGKLDTGDFEESDEDTDNDDDDADVGKSKTSSKKAYKAQKQLYDLTIATKKLSEQMEHLSGPLKKGQKIIESLEKFGIKKFV